jgi:hypothetical protein
MQLKPLKRVANRVTGKIVLFYTLRAQLPSRDRSLEPLSCYPFAPICGKYAGLGAQNVYRAIFSTTGSNEMDPPPSSTAPMSQPACGILGNRSPQGDERNDDGDAVVHRSRPDFYRHASFCMAQRWRRRSPRLTVKMLPRQPHLQGPQLRFSPASTSRFPASITCAAPPSRGQRLPGCRPGGGQCSGSSHRSCAAGRAR